MENGRADLNMTENVCYFSYSVAFVVTGVVVVVFLFVLASYNFFSFLFFNFFIL